jgi:hypothetical protein
LALLFSSSFTAVRAEQIRKPMSSTNFILVDDQETRRSASKPYRLVIFLHGIGGFGSVMAAIGSSWKWSLADTKFIAPNAPFSHRSGGHQWFGVDDQVLRPVVFRLPGIRSTNSYPASSSARGLSTVWTRSPLSACLRERSWGSTQFHPVAGG